jgi:hypothetical protein
MNMDILLDTVDARWKALSPQDREIFERQAADENDRYQRELREFEQKQSQHMIPRAAPEEEDFLPPNRKRNRSDRNDNVSANTFVSYDHTRRDMSPPTRPVQSTRRNHAYVLGEIAPPFQTSHRRPLPLLQRPHPQPPKYGTSCKEASSFQENLPLLEEGTEVELTMNHQRRKYRIHYQCIPMTKAQAEDYIRNLSHGRLSLPPPVERENANALE